MRRATRLAAVFACFVMVGSCGSEGDGSTAGEGGSDSTIGVPTEPAATTAQVIEAVSAATSVVKLPSDLTPSLTDAEGDAGFNMLKDRGCLPNFKSTSMDLDRCVFGDPDGLKTMVILGDSHASMWLPAFDVLGKQSNWIVYDLSKVSCGAADIDDPYLSQEERLYSECVTWHQWAHQTIRELEPDLVVLASLVNEYRTGKSDVMSPDHWREGLEKTIAEVASPNTKVAILGDIPEMARKPPDCLAAHMDDVSTCSSAAADVVGSTYHAAEEAAADNTQSTYIDVIPWLCSSTCTTIVDDKLVYSNTQHITATYARYLVGALGEALAPLMPTS